MGPVASGCVAHAHAHARPRACAPARLCARAPARLCARAPARARGDMWQGLAWLRLAPLGSAWLAGSKNVSIENSACNTLLPLFTEGRATGRDQTLNHKTNDTQRENTTTPCRP